MANVPGFLSPRSDLTIRGVPPEKMEAIVNAVVDILGGRVEFSETAIYESEDTTKPDLVENKQCSKTYSHPLHHWVEGEHIRLCYGINVETYSHG